MAKLESRERLKVRSRLRLQLVRSPDALHRTHGNSDGLGHRAAGPMGRRLVRRYRAGQRHYLRRGVRRERRFAGPAGLDRGVRARSLA